MKNDPALTTNRKSGKGVPEFRAEPSHRDNDDEELARQLCIRFSRMASLEQRFGSLCTRIDNLERRITDLADKMTRLNVAVKTVAGQVNDVQDMTMRLAQDKVMTGARERDEWLQFLERVRAFLDTAREELLRLRVNSVLDDLMHSFFTLFTARPEDFPNATAFDARFDGFLAHLAAQPPAKNDRVTEQEWSRAKERIVSMANAALASDKGVLERIDEMAKRFDGVKRFADILVCPKKGEAFNGETMETRTNTDDGAAYVVSTVQALGLLSRCLPTGTRKAYVTVSRLVTSVPGQVPVISIQDLSSSGQAPAGNQSLDGVRHHDC